jgi:hypothetical protein
MIYSFIFVLSIVVANLTVATFGVWFSPINAFLLIGLDLSLRDKLHDKWEGNPLKIGLLIAVSGVVSYLINPATGMIAIASVTAFCLSMIADAFVYQRLLSKSWMIKSNGSNIAGAGVDSIVFPTIAFGDLMWQIVLMQFVAKVIGGLIWSKIIEKFNLNKNAL